MNFWEKLVNDPGRGPWTGSPLARAVLGLGLLFFALYTYISDSIRISKAGDGIYIHFADHPKIFVVTIVFVALASAWALASARKRFRMHGG